MLRNIGLVVTIVVLANILAFIGVTICAFTHALSLIDVVPGFLVLLFAAALLAVFPLGGLATVLALRAGNWKRVMPTSFQATPQ